MHAKTLLFLEPGHFHAALCLKVASPRVDADVHVYARPGPDLEAFTALVEAFNARAERPTGWRLHRHESAAPLAQLLEERAGQIVILAGRNDTKLAQIAAVHAAGFHVLADKPWLIDARALPDLEAVTHGSGPLAEDIMTERFDTMARLRHRIVGCTALFGELRGRDEAPAIDIASRHHLYKIVNGRVLRRPPWYYDVTVQGDGLVDIQAHMTDQAQWLIGGDREFDFARDVELISARRWATPVPATLFEESTGKRTMPAALAATVRDGDAQLPCNGEIRYRLCGVEVRQVAEWGQREPPGSGDQHAATVRGTRAVLELELGPATGFRAQMWLRPVVGTVDALRRASSRELAAWRDEFPGIDVTVDADRVRMEVPDAIRTTHESHFARVLDQFLDRVEEGQTPASVRAAIQMRYALLAGAHERAVTAAGAS